MRVGILGSRLIGGTLLPRMRHNSTRRRRGFGPRLAVRESGRHIYESPTYPAR